MGKIVLILKYMYSYNKVNLWPNLSFEKLSSRGQSLEIGSEVSSKQESSVSERT